MLHAVFSFEFRIPHSAFGTANFFMDDTLLRFLKYNISRPGPYFLPKKDNHVNT
jgi:hypothetical protein